MSDSAVAAPMQARPEQFAYQEPVDIPMALGIFSEDDIRAALTHGAFEGALRAPSFVL
jgi:hypothetical protein